KAFDRLLSNHGGAEVAQHRVDRIRNRNRTAAADRAAREAQADRARVRRGIFEQERTGVAAVLEAAPAVRDYDLVRIRLHERVTARALVPVLDRERAVDGRNRAARETGRAAHLLDRLAD